ncbi:MAG: hypothetical protein ABIN24_09940 [Dyadobacter sp.]
MDIDRCNSIFELFAAFNFTYAVLAHPENGSTFLSPQESSTRSFADIVDSYLIKPFDNVTKLIQPVEKRLNRLTLSLETLRNSSQDTDQIKKINDVLQNAHSTDWLIKVFQDKVSKDKDLAKDRINSRFPHASLLLALFCISVLVLAASTSFHKHLTLLALNCLLLIQVLWFFILPEFSRNKLTYRNILYTYASSLILVTVFHFILKFYIFVYHCDQYHYLLEIIDNNEVIRPFFILLNLVLPFCHFVFYYISFITSTSRKERKATAEIALIISAVDSIEISHKKIQPIISNVLSE